MSVIDRPANMLHSAVPNDHRTKPKNYKFLKPWVISPYPIEQRLDLDRRMKDCEIFVIRDRVSRSVSGVVPKEGVPAIMLLIQSLFTPCDLFVRIIKAFIPLPGKAIGTDHSPGFLSQLYLVKRFGAA